MQIVNAGYEPIDVFNAGDKLKKIERIARVCYKSEDKIAEGTAERLVGNLIKRGHEAMLEHTSFIFLLDYEAYQYIVKRISLFTTLWEFNSFLRITTDCRFVISGNARAWRDFFKYELQSHSVLPYFFKQFVEDNTVLFPEYQAVNFVFPDTGAMQELTPKDLLTDNERRTHWDVTVKFTVDRGVSHEIVRHRVASFAQESTRYCNYGNKGGEITFIEPCYLKDSSISNWDTKYGAWRAMCENAELMYLRMSKVGATPEEARAVLPTSLKTEIVMTANLREWRHFFTLRAVGVTGKPHPQMLEVSVPLLKDLQKQIPVIFDDLQVE